MRSAFTRRTYDLLVGYVLQLLAKGRHRTGIELLFSLLRWNWLVTTTRPLDEFKLNQNYKAWYARYLMHKNPDFEGMFELRARSTD